MTAFYTAFEPELTGSGAQAELRARIGSTAACAGPWSDDLQHGGPPSALLVLAAERLAAAAAGRDDLLAVRLAAEFVGPVPVADLELTARVHRLSRSAVLVSAELRQGERTSLQARIWLLGPGELPRPAQAVPTRTAPSGKTVPEELPEFAFDHFGYGRQLDWRPLSGSPAEPGPALMWIRPRIPLTPATELSALQRAALIADSASGIASELDWQSWSFANVDLDLHLFRAIHGPWLLMDAHTELGAGVAMARSSLSDLDGSVGGGLQTLLVRRSGK